jgi:hypothetical protein
MDVQFKYFPLDPAYVTNSLKSSLPYKEVSAQRTRHNFNNSLNLFSGYRLTVLSV